MKTLGTILLIVAIGIGAVIFWPAPNPLKGVETVALEDVPDTVSILIEDSVITIGDNTFTVTNDASRADAIITFHNVNEARANIEISSESGFRANAHFVLDVEKNGERTLMDLYIDVDNAHVETRLVGRKFYEVWKHDLTQR